MLVEGMILQHCWRERKSQEKPWSLSHIWCCDAGQGWAALGVHYKRLCDILFYLQGRQLSAKQHNVNCCHIHLLQSTSVYPKYSPCSCRTGVLQFVSSWRSRVLLCKA